MRKTYKDLIITKAAIPKAEVDITNWRELLTEEEVDECKAFTAKIHWGFNSKSLKKQIKRFENGDIKEKCKVYFILEDCNFHEVASMLARGKVQDAWWWAHTEII